MKLCNLLYNELRPQFKCGADPVSAAITAGVGAVGNIMGNVISSEQQQDNVDYQISAQKEENKLNRDWQTAEAEKARQFEAGQTLQQNQFTKDLAFQQQQYNMQNQRMQAFYQSPVYQRQQLQAANINPQVYFGQQSSFSGSSAPVAGLPSAPSGAKGHMPAGVAGLSPISFQPEHLNLGSIISNVTGSIKSLAEAKKLGVETGWIDDQMRAQIRKLTADSDLAEVMALGQKIINSRENAKLPYAYRMAELEVAKACSEVALNEQNKITLESAKKVNDALAKLHEAQKGLTDKESQKLGIEMPYYAQVLQSVINKNSAEASQANANVGLIEANAEQVKFYNGVLQQHGVKQSLVDAAKEAGKKAVAERKISERQAKQIEYLVEQAAYATDMQEFTYWSNQVNSFVGTIGQAASQFYGAGALRELIKLRQGSQVSPSPIHGFTP